MPSDIESSVRLRPDVLAISVPVSDIHIQKRLQKDRGWILDRLFESVYQAKCGEVKYISLGFEDATRADKEFLHAAFKRAMESGADRVRFSDTLGIATAREVTALAGVGRQRDIELAIHAHNDFGMATANAMAAL